MSWSAVDCPSRRPHRRRALSTPWSSGRRGLILASAARSVSCWVWSGLGSDAGRPAAGVPADGSGLGEAEQAAVSRTDSRARAIGVVFFIGGGLVCAGCLSLMPALDSAALPLDCTMVLPRGLLRRRGHGAVHAGSHHLMKSPAFRTVTGRERRTTPRPPRRLPLSGPRLRLVACRQHQLRLRFRLKSSSTPGRPSGG